jgi:hypothetical protein
VVEASTVTGNSVQLQAADDLNATAPNQASNGLGKFCGLRVCAGDHQQHG